MNDLKKWRGLKGLVEDAVENGSRAIQKIQLETAARPFAILERLPVVAAPAKTVHLIHDATVSATHAAVRVIAKAVGGAVDVAFDAASSEDERR
jgi:hypothetical protein